MLIAARALLGVAGATLAPSTLSLIRNMFHDRPAAHGRHLASGSRATRSAARSGRSSAASSCSASRGAPSSCSAFRSWRCSCSSGRGSCRSSAIPNAGRLDLRSAALSLASVLLVIYGAEADRGARLRLAAPRSSIAAGVAIGVVFLRRQRHARATRCVDLRLFRRAGVQRRARDVRLRRLRRVRRRTSSSRSTSSSCSGLSPLSAGLWTLPWSAGFIVGSMLTPALVRRVSPRPPSWRGGLVARRDRLRHPHPRRRELAVCS